MTPCDACPFAACQECEWQWSAWDDVGGQTVVNTNEVLPLEGSSDPRECVNTPGARPEPSKEVRHDEYTRVRQ